MDGIGCARVRLKTVAASLRSVVRLQTMRRGNVFVSTRRRSKVCDGRVDVRRARLIFARAPSLKSSTVRHELDLGAFVAVCWKYDRARPSDTQLPWWVGRRFESVRGLRK